MAIDPRIAILQMMMQQSGRGAPPGGVNPGLMTPGMPASMAPGVGHFGDSGVEETAAEVQDMMTPSDEDPIPPSAFPPVPETAPGMQGGLPPQIMALAAQGIRPGDVGMPMPPNEPPGAMMPPRGDYSRGKAHVGPESRDIMTPSDEDPDIDPDEYDGRVDPGTQAKYDPRFGPIKDKSREETEGEIESVRNSMSERSLQAIEDDIREAAETGDTSAIEVLLTELEEQGYEVAELPPDVQQMINVQDEENVRPTVENDNEED